MQDGGPLGCTGLTRIELVVSDLDRSAGFYRDVVGLTPLDHGPLVRSFAVGQDGGRLVLSAQGRVGCSLAAWQVAEDGELDRLEHRLAIAGVVSERANGPYGARGVRFVEPITGAPLAFEGPVSCTPAQRFVETHTRIQRLGHVVIATPEADAAVEWVQERLDFRLSDWIDGGTSFLRPALSAHHHGLGITRGPAAGLHHLNFMVEEIDDIGRAFHRMARAGVRVVFGPGRHPISSSVFLYFLDPDGLILEYSFGMERFPAHGARPPRAWPSLPSSVDLWGAPGSVDLGRTGAFISVPPRRGRP